MVGRGVERIEAVVLVFDLWSVRQGEAHAAKDLDGFVADEGERVQSSGRQGAGGEGEVDSGKGGLVGDFLQSSLFLLDGGSDRGAGGVERLAEGGLFLVGYIFDKGSCEREGAFFPDGCDTGIIEGTLVRSGGYKFEGGGLDGGDLLVHGRGKGIAE